MKQLWLTARLDIVESLRARWFLIYTGVFGGIVAVSYTHLTLPTILLV